MAGLALALMPSFASAEAAKLEVNEVRVGILPIAVQTPIFSAQELGYFAQEGLKVTTQFGESGAALLPLAIQGQLQIVNIPISTGLQARAQKLDIVMIGPGTVMEMHPTAGTIARAGSSIHQLSDLTGETIAVNVINSVNWLYNRALLEKAGVDLKTVKYVELPFTSMTDAVINGSVDAAATSQPFLYLATKTGKITVLGRDLYDVQPNVQVSGFAVARKWAQANPHTLAAFERALARAVDYMMADGKHAVPLIAKFTKTDPKLIEEAGLPSWSNELSVSNVNTQMQLMIRHGLLKQPIDVNALIWKD
jgi:NitT/TauT family transport system substrate-binding protein